MYLYMYQKITKLCIRRKNQIEQTIYKELNKKKPNEFAVDKNLHIND
jgi:hypothetical protein